jgi:putative ABC transport system permease protein
MIGASFMYLQNRFMQNSDMGYVKDGIITVEMSQIEKSINAFTNQLKAYSGIDDVSYSAILFSGSDAYSKWGMQYRGKNITFQVIPVHHAFLDVMGIKVTEGRDFRREDMNTEGGAYIFNESARKQFELELNTSLEGWKKGEIIGFMPDVKFASFRMAVEPMAFYLPSESAKNSVGEMGFAYIKLHQGANIRDALTHIQTTLAGYEANYPFEIRFFDEVLQRLYEKEKSLSSLISLFSIMAIFISIVGVFGLVMFDSECRRKEIGIRKVLGASTIGIIIMFNKAYLKILVICFVIAAPLAWYAVDRWLQNFAYKTPMYWWVYLLAFVVVRVITVCTVTCQNWRVANDDPVKAIKAE